jgi:TolB protein
MVSGATAQTPDPLPGRLLFIKDGNLWQWQGGSAYQLATGGTWSQPSWSPDGSNLAYVYRGQNFSDIFITDDRGTSQTRLTESQATILENNDWNMRPAWSPDGGLIAFVSDRTTAFPAPWVMNAENGRGQRQVHTPGLNPEAVDSLAWSPDGSELALTIFNEPGPTHIAVVSAAPNSRQPGRVVTSPPGGGLDPAWSPDGAWLAFASHVGKALEIHVVQPDGSAAQAVTHDGLLARSPVWSPDGRHIAYLSNRGGYFEVWVVEVASNQEGAMSAVGSPRQLTRDLNVDAASGLSWSP